MLTCSHIATHQHWLDVGISAAWSRYCPSLFGVRNANQGSSVKGRGVQAERMPLRFFSAPTLVATYSPPSSSIPFFLLLSLTLSLAQAFKHIAQSNYSAEPCLLPMQTKPSRTLPFARFFAWTNLFGVGVKPFGHHAAGLSHIMFPNTSDKYRLPLTWAVASL